MGTVVQKLLTWIDRIDRIGRKDEVRTLNDE
jgi:hypothetical protein